MTTAIGETLGKSSMETTTTAAPTIRVEIYNQTYSIRSDGDSEYLMQLADAKQSATMRALLSINEMFRPYIVAKGIPADRMAALREAFYRTITSEPFLDEARKLDRTVQNQMRGEDVARLVDDILKIYPETIAGMKEAIR